MNLSPQNLLISLLIVFGTLNASSQQRLRQKVGELVIGKSSIATVKELFGEPDHEEFMRTWVEEPGSKKNSRRVRYFEPDRQPGKSFSGARLRRLSCFGYEQNGFEFCFLDNPSELHSMKFTKRNLFFRGSRVGDPLHLVQGRLGKRGAWWSTVGRNYYWFDYRRRGIRFLFERSPARPRHPTKPETNMPVNAIEIYDRRISFH